MDVEFSYSACLVRLIPKVSHECLHFLTSSVSFLYMQCLDIGIWTLEIQVDLPLPSDSAGEKLVIVFLLGPRHTTSLLVVRVWIQKFLAIFSCPSVCFCLLPCLCMLFCVYVSVKVVFELLDWMSRDSGDFMNLLENLSFTLRKRSPPSWGGLCSSVLVAVLGLLLWAWLCRNQNLTRPLSSMYMVSLWFLFVLCCKFTAMCPAF